MDLNQRESNADRFTLNSLNLPAENIGFIGVSNHMRFPSAQKIFFSVTAFAAIFWVSACTQLKQPEPEPYFAETPPPPKQELRWSNGKSPKSLDPAQAAAAPETDIARALYEGLTDLDPKTLTEIPAIAENWESADDDKIWRFFLRENAVWTNGKAVTAQDFVRSWKRLRDLGEKTAHRNLLLNILGFQKQLKNLSETTGPDFLVSSEPPAYAAPNASPTASPSLTEGAIGVFAESDTVFRVELLHSDKDFPKLVAHPIFRPVFDAAEFENGLKKAVVTNGAFRLSSLNADAVTLDRSETYWDRDSVKLERIEFVAAQTPEKALDAYRTGRIDTVTNAEFSPAALKLLEPFEDFRRTTHSALNYYELNTERAPYSDRRVRQALAIAIEREKLTEGELQGTTRPATTFTPAGSRGKTRISLDVQRATILLDEAGFPNGKGFPIIRLLINRNDAQQRVARAVAQMWKQNLNLATEIVVKEGEDLKTAITGGDYDIIRRGMVLPTADETANFLSIFGPNATNGRTDPADQNAPSEFQKEGAIQPNSNSSTAASEAKQSRGLQILSEDDALYELRAIPLYFPTSYSLVKPYVKGLDSNSLDSPSLKSIEIDPNWRTR